MDVDYLVGNYHHKLVEEVVRIDKEECRLLPGEGSLANALVEDSEPLEAAGKSPDTEAASSFDCSAENSVVAESKDLSRARA